MVVIGSSALLFSVASLLLWRAKCPSCGQRLFRGPTTGLLATSCAHCGVPIGGPIAPAVTIANGARARLAAFAARAGFRARGPFEIEGYRRGVLVRIALDPMDLHALVEANGSCAAGAAVTRIELDADDLDDQKLEGAVGDVIEAAVPESTGAYR